MQSRRSRLRTLLAAVVTVPLAQGLGAATLATPITVSVTLLPASGATASTGRCVRSSGTGAFGATITVVCGERATANPSSDFRLLARVQGAHFDGTIDSYSPPGTTMAFRIAGESGREWVEMMVAW